MTLRTKIYIGLSVAAILAAAAILGAAWSNHKINTLENAVQAAKQSAENSKQLADKRELESAEYKQKIEYLETQLTDIQTTARRQDEKLEKLSVNSGRARRDVERAKRVRSIDTDAGELCRKLAELGHSCSSEFKVQSSE